MSEKETKSLDILGVKPIGEAINTLVKGSIDGAAAFLSRICLPAAEEFGLLLRDKVSQWRANNLVKVAENAQEKLRSTPERAEGHAHPRMVSLIVDHGAWADTDDVQEMWGGLLASSFTEDGKDESNLIFINILSQLTSSEARMLNYGCENVKKNITKDGWLDMEEEVYVNIEELKKIAGVDDIYRIDRELDHLTALGLIEEGLLRPTPWGNFIQTTILRKRSALMANLCPTDLGLQMYVRCQGSLLSPAKYFSPVKKYEA